MKIRSKVMKKRWGNQIKVNVDFGGTQGVVLLALDGWDLSKYENREGRQVTWGSGIDGCTKGLQFRFSMNGPIKMTYSEWLDFVEAIDQEWANLRAMEGDI